MRIVFTYSFAALLASAALAAPPDARSDGAIVAAVQHEFLAPFAEWRAEHSKFSRAAMPPSEMRVRLLSKPHQDAEGAEFVPFAVDTRRVDGEWQAAQMTGCVYVTSSAVYVKRGGGFRAAADYFALRDTNPNTSVCVSPTGK